MQNPQILKFTRFVRNNLHDSFCQIHKETTRNVTKSYLDENLADFDKIVYAEQEIQIDLGDGIMVNGRGYFGQTVPLISVETVPL